MLIIALAIIRAIGRATIGLRVGRGTSAAAGPLFSPRLCRHPKRQPRDAVGRDMRPERLVGRRAPARGAPAVGDVHCFANGFSL